MAVNPGAPGPANPASGPATGGERRTTGSLPGRDALAARIGPTLQPLRRDPHRLGA